MITKSRVRGMFLGLSIGDALGMPVETMTLKQIAEKFGRIDHYIRPDGHKWYDGAPAGTWTDDTQLSLAVAESLIACRGIDLDDIAKRHVQAMQESTLGWGGSTIESVSRLTNGVHWSKSGKSGKAGGGCGNGVAMKVASLGIWAALNWGIEVWMNPSSDFIFQLQDITWMTHRSGMAVASALSQMFAIAYLIQTDPSQLQRDRFAKTLEFGAKLGETCRLSDEPGDKISDRIKNLSEMDWASLTAKQISDLFGRGNSYIYNSLPFTYAFFLRNPYSIETLYDVASAGGDTDTNASMVGALLGALHGEDIFPVDLIRNLWRAEEIIDTAERFSNAFDIPE